MAKRDPEHVLIAKRVALELRDGDVVNLGVGIPTLVPDYMPEGKVVFLQSENGLLGMGPTPPPEEVDMEFINASKQPVTAIPGASIFNSAESFAMIRGGHIDVAVLGALQVDQTGMIANWLIPGRPILGVGGAMDLVAGAKKIILAMTHTSKDGKPKLLKKLTFPISGIRKAEMVITEKAVFRFADDKMILLEIHPDMTVDELRAITEAEFEVSSELKPYAVKQEVHA